MDWSRLRKITGCLLCKHKSSGSASAPCCGCTTAVSSYEPDAWLVDLCCEYAAESYKRKQTNISDTAKRIGISIDDLAQHVGTNQAAIDEIRAKMRGCVSDMRAVINDGEYALYCYRQRR